MHRLDAKNNAAETPVVQSVRPICEENISRTFMATVEVVMSTLDKTILFKGPY